MIDEASSPVDHWRIGKEVPIPLIITIIIQTIAFIVWVTVWGTSLSARLSVLETYVTEAKTQTAGALQAERQLSERLIKVETLLGEVRDETRDISRKLDAVPRPTQVPTR